MVEIPPPKNENSRRFIVELDLKSGKTYFYTLADIDIGIYNDKGDAQKHFRELISQAYKPKPTKDKFDLYKW